MPAEKSYIRCRACRDRKDDEKFQSLELVQWDGVTPLNLWGDDTYFFAPEDVYDYADNYNLKVSELQLVICEPNFAREVDGEYWCDDLPEDGELPPWLEDAVDQINAAIHAHKADALSWGPGKQRVSLPDDPEAS